MPNSKNPESTEMYLETILKLRQNKNYVRSIDIATEMGFSKPSVSIAMKGLRESGYIITENDGNIVLTDKGNDIATRVYERHRVLTRIFENLGVSHETAENDACRVEHFISEETFEALKEHAKKYGEL
ncbi:MAG: metal-dependent transcriptional regulator [Candidatus Avilachnospira sp.]|jgi:DtxR family Mn-dependent transcriptional regulator